MKLLRLALVLCACSLLASSALAQSFYWDTASARSQALGGIYVTSSDDALDALAANPAGLTSLTGRTLDDAHANNPVPSSTLTPLTAAIMSNQISTGLIYHPGRSNFEFAYSYDPTAQAQVQQRALLSGEYNNSTVRVGTHHNPEPLAAFLA